MINAQQSIFDILDDELFEQIRRHPECKVIKSFVSIKGQNRQFKYIYADDPKFVLGQGSFGKVLVCFHEGQEEPVKLALKIIKVPQQYTQIKAIEHIVATSRQQIIALIKLRQNKHIIKIEDITREENQIFIMLEFCNERDLNYYFTKLKNEGKIKNEFDVRYYFSQILNAFQELNKHNFMHRDIKPSNILVHNGVLKVADFGLARQIFQEQRESFEEQVGTMITMAPQILFHEQYTSKCDIYSLGVILYWMIYDKFPFEKAPKKQDFQHNKIDFSKSQYSSERLEKILREMLAYQEENRIGWTDLLNDELFNHPVLQQEQEKIKLWYEKKERAKMRQTYGRNFGTQMTNDDLFLETAIPKSYYKFIREIDGEEEYNKFLAEERNSFQENSSFYSHNMIKQEYRNQNIRIKFYQMLILQLENLDPEAQKLKKQVVFWKSLLVYCLHKYKLYRMNQVKDELVSVIPPKIFKIDHLKQAQEEPIYKDFVETVAERVKGSEFMMGNKYSSQTIKKLQYECEEYQILGQISVIFDEINQRNQDIFLAQLDQIIIETIYCFKIQIRKIEKTKNIYIYKALILCVHHLFMFTNQDDIFPRSYQKQFPYRTFLEREEFKNQKYFKILNEKILELLHRFE